MALKKSDFIVLCDRLGLQKIVAGSPERQLTTILYHNFFFEGDNRDVGRDRLKRQCEWLRNTYSPVTTKGARAALNTGIYPPSPLLVTIDDAKVQVLDVLDIFESFEIPLLLFVCVGWTDRGSPIDEGTALSRIVAELHWYEGPAQIFEFGGRSVSIEPGGNARVIDGLLEAAENDSQISFANLAAELDQATETASRDICNWDEIVELVARGVEIGSHSVSHAMLGKQSDRRLRYEIAESKKVLSRKTGSCSHFAYPYGIRGSFDARSAELLRGTGYADGFITKADFASGDSNSFELPRIVLPEMPMKLIEFKARVRGGGIPLTALKQMMS